VNRTAKQRHGCCWRHEVVLQRRYTRLEFFGPILGGIVLDVIPFRKKRCRSSVKGAGDPCASSEASLISEFASNLRGLEQSVQSFKDTLRGLPDSAQKRHALSGLDTALQIIRTELALNARRAEIFVP
jgi:hypothetical protein